MDPDIPTIEAEDEFEAELYLEVLKEDPPFKRYVSRGDTPDLIDIPDPHLEADRAVARAVRMTKSDKTPRIQPVLGSAGMGKTHLFWVLKDRESNSNPGPYRAVYVPSPPSPVRVPLHFYACLVDEIGTTMFDDMADTLLMRYGELQGRIKKHYDFSDLMQRALQDYPGVAADPVKVLFQYRIVDDKRDLARRWLLGEALSPEELEALDVRTYLEDDDVTIATFKILTEGTDRPILLFIDEMEGPFNTYGEEGERRFLEVLKRLYNECSNILIIASCLTEIWDRIYSLADAPTRSRMETPVRLEKFSRDHVATFVEETMELYWDEYNIDPPPNPYFPLTEDDITLVYERSNGIPREAIRQVIARVDEVLFGKTVTEAEGADYVIKLTPSVVIGAIVKALQILAEAQGLKVELQAAKGSTKKESAAIMSINNGTTEYFFSIEVPNVKNWDRSGGVAAYYSARRLSKALSEGLVQLAIVAVPEATSGAKFESVVNESGEKIAVLRLTSSTASDLIDTTNSGQIPEEQKSFFEAIVHKFFAP
ncbi:MAG: hypothetical protein K9W43_12530 [Candidatus Thorarchaeota archaeon]|nr:hypothetical protein [Candidatus Thorarchaeota archaeon]